MATVKWKLEHHASLDESGALPFAAIGYAELLEAGMADREQMLMDGRWKTITCKRDGKLVGVLCYDSWNHARRWWVYFASVDPEYRRIGVYTRMWNYLVKCASGSGVRTIGGATYADNVPMQKAYAACGRKLRSLTYEYEISQ